MPYTPPSTLYSTPHKNFAERSSKNNSAFLPKSHTQPHNESGRDGRKSKAFPNGTSSTETQEAKEISDLMSRIQAKGKDEKRECTSSPYDSLHLMDNDAIPDTPRRQTENVGTNGSGTSSSAHWAASPRAFPKPQQPSAPLLPGGPSTSWGRWGSTQTTPDIAGEFARNVPSFRKLAVHSIVNAGKNDESSKSKLHHSSSGEDSIEFTRKCVPGYPKSVTCMDETEKEDDVSGTLPLSRPIDYTQTTELFDSTASVVAQSNQFLEATSTNTQENANEGSWRPQPWPTHPYPFPSEQSSESSNPFISSPRYPRWHNPTPSPGGYSRTDYPPYSPPFGNSYPFAATPSPRYTDITERRKSPSEQYRRARYRHRPTPSPRPETGKRTPRHNSEGMYSTFSSWHERWMSARAARIRRIRREILSIQRENLSIQHENLSIQRAILSMRPYGRSGILCLIVELPQCPTQCKLWSKKYVPKETADDQFQYQDPPQTLSKLQDNGANSRGRILIQRRNKRSLGKKSQHNTLDSSPDLSASAEERSREDEPPSRTELQLMGRHKLSNWKLHNGKSKDWRKKSSATILTARQFRTAIYSHKWIHYSKVHAEVPRMVGFGHDIPVAAQRSRRDETSMVVRNEFPAFLPWLDRKGFRDMGMKRDHMRDILDRGEPKVEAHRKLGLRPELTAETDCHMDAYAYFSESNRQLQFLPACPPAKISQDANNPNCLSIHYVGRVIPSPYGFLQLSEHIESSAHAEVYKICYLYIGYESYARIYTLRGIHPNQRKRRVENLKKLSKLNQFLTAFDWEGKKVCVFSHQYKTKYISLFGEDPTPKAAGIGAIGRRNTKEYDAAFPPLPTSTPIPVPIKLPDKATAPLTPEQELHIKTLEVIKSEIEEMSPTRWKSISKEPLPLAERLMIRLMDLNAGSVAKRNSEWKVKDGRVHLKNEGNRKWNEDGKGKDLEATTKKKRGRKKKSEKRVVV